MSRDNRMYDLTNAAAKRISDSLIMRGLTEAAMVYVRYKDLLAALARENAYEPVRMVEQLLDWLIENKTPGSPEGRQGHCRRGPPAARGRACPGRRAGRLARRRRGAVAERGRRDCRRRSAARRED